MSAPERTDEQVADLQPAPVDPFTQQAQRLHRAGLDREHIDAYRDRYEAWGEDARASFRNALGGVSDRDLADEDGAPGPVLTRFDADDDDVPEVAPSGVVPAADDEPRTDPGADLSDPSQLQPPTPGSTGDDDEDENEGTDAGGSGGTDAGAPPVPGGDGGGATAEAPFDPTKLDQDETITKLEALETADEVEAVLAAERARTDRYAGGRQGVTAAAERILADKRAAQDG